MRPSNIRRKAGTEAYALFRGNSQLTATYPTKDDVFRAALLEGLIPAIHTADGSQKLPADHCIKKVELSYDAQPDLKSSQERPE